MSGLTRVAVVWVALATASACTSETKSPDQAPVPTGVGVTAPAPVPAPAPVAIAPEGKWFVETGCAKCHAVSVYGVVPEVQIGPDLALAKEDVQTRFGVELDEFFANPSGTMALVLSSQIVLSPEQRKDAIHRLEEAFEAHKKKGGGAAVANH